MHVVATLLFPEFELLDVFGPLEMFGLLPDQFHLTMIAQQGGSVVSAQGPRVAIDQTLDAVDTPPDILLVPGGRGTRREVDNPILLDWLRRTGARAGMVTSVCTGSALLARAGLLDGRRATTNKRAFDWVTTQGPATDWQASACWIEDGKFFTSSGISAGIDMALGIIARLHGAEAATEVANRAEYTANTDPGNDPFARAPETLNQDPS